MPANFTINAVFNEIFSLIAPDIPIGIDLPGPQPPTQFPHIGGAVHKPLCDSCIFGLYPYFTVIGKKVAVSTNEQDSVIWQAIEYPDQNAYIVVRGDDPSVGWTVTGGGQIAIEKIVREPNLLPTQLFAFKNSA